MSEKPQRSSKRVGLFVTCLVDLFRPSVGFSAVKLLEKKRDPTDEDIDLGMSGNICRCGTYMRIREAIKKAAGDLG